MATFKQAPLPFVGQKRQFLKHFEAVLDKNIEGNGEDWTIIDVFGGSGLLSHTAKRKKPLARVIYNDFDGYTKRLKHIKDINRLRQEIYQTIADIVPKSKRLNKDLKAEIINKINGFSGYKDLNCLTRWLLFSGEQVSSLDELFKEDFWHCVRKSDYPEADGYLDGVEVVSESFHQLLPQYQSQEKTLFVLDPPYLCSRQESYKQAHYFGLIDFLRLIHLTRSPYIFFSSTKSEFIRFIDAMIEDKWQNWQAFEKYNRMTLQTSVCYSSKYEDNLVYKF
ncbi:hypothetical protein E4T80_08075 [Muribacter muris]|uniref:D12 class N6 adenine-specific DNA methyltransferase n=1 Tax=Muribacter muris TaxID=67855 RepID=A0A4Y9JYG5_9PAST|nr:hypothetical protein [Muribacter muris]MBF0785415.1 hypothetical protein [Muribacter muris]MBF0828063.1 hypothetical protein [Muribacter muris]TFV09547.1 hypothetical protein E4T80_08075 [Muribacter muris]